MNGVNRRLCSIFAKGAIAVLLDEGRLEFDIWMSLNKDTDINIYYNGEVASATVYPVKNGVVDTTEGGWEVYSINLTGDDQDENRRQLHSL